MRKAPLTVFICFPHCGFQVLLVTTISALFPHSLFEQPSLPHGSLGRRFNLNLASALGYLHIALRGFLHIGDFSLSHYGYSLGKDAMATSLGWM